MVTTTARECPGVEALAAFADGGLTLPERSALREHLGRCAECTAVVAACVRDGRPGARSSGRVTLALAATVVVATGIAALVAIRARDERPVAGSGPGPMAASDQAGTAVPTHADRLLALARPADLVAGLHRDEMPEQSFTGGPDRQTRSFRLGIGATDLAVAVATGSTTEAHRLVRDLRSLVPADRRAEWDALAQSEAPGTTIRAALPQLVRLAREAGETGAFDLGAWVEAARLAAGTGARRFFDTPRAASPETLPEPAIRLLVQVDAALAKGPTSDLVLVNRLLEETLALF